LVHKGLHGLLQGKPYFTWFIIVIIIIIIIVVGIANGYGLDDRGIGVRVAVISSLNYSISSMPVQASTQPPIQWVTGALSLGVKRQGREVTHSHSTGAEVKTMRIYTFTPPYILMA
jgi:hypothetical protein